MIFHRPLSSFVVLTLFAALTACGSRETLPKPVKPVTSAAPATSPPVVVPPVDAPAPAGAKLSKEEGFKCDLAVVDSPKELKLGVNGVKIKVKLTKRTDEEWPVMLPKQSPNHAVNLAYHWLNGITGAPVKEGDRIALPANLGNGTTIELELPVSTPATAGDYALKIEPVQEGVGWFAEMGGCSQTVKIKVVL